MKKIIVFSVVLAMATLSTLSTMAQNVNIYAIYTDLPCTVAKPTKVRIPDASVRITDYGAKGDGITLCTDAIQKAINELSEKGGGHVIVPEGLWLFTPIELKSNIDLHLDDNAMMILSTDKTLFKPESKSRSRFQGAIWALGQHDIAITGNGVIEGNGKYWRPVKRGKQSDTEWKKYLSLGGAVTDDGKMWLPYNLKGKQNISQRAENEENLRADMVSLKLCERVLLQNITVQNSPRFHVHPLSCKDVVIENITVRCPWNAQNGDGIDLTNCQRVLVYGNTVDVGDDGICLKGRDSSKELEAYSSRDMLIQNNKVCHAHGGFVLGSNIIGGMENIVVRHCSFSNTDTGLRFKSAIDRGGDTKNIFIYDIMMNDIANEAITFSCNYENKVKEDAKKLFVPHFKDIHISSIYCGECRVGLAASGIQGYDCVKDITISDSRIQCSEKDVAVDTTTVSVGFNRKDFIMTRGINTIGK